MSKIVYISLSYLKKVIGHFRKKSDLKFDYTDQAASNQIKSAIESNKAFMVARIGFVEINCMSGYVGSQLGLNKYIHFLKDNLRSYEINNYVLQTANINAGLFPPEKEVVANFSKLMLKDIEQLDILGSLSGYESYFIKKNNNLKLIKARDIEPYYVDKPWSSALKGKRVLVIHPFAESIEKQYLVREKLFDNPDILPEFTLLTLKSVQSAAGEKNFKFKNWFQALDYMKTEINKKDFDIAIIGCGAYGFPLAAHIKRLGKQAIHMGGATQILFGIKGKRWENHPKISKLFNDYWIRPNQNEIPKNSNKVEDGCYW